VLSAIRPFSVGLLSKENFLARPTGAGDFNFAVNDVAFLLLMTVGDTLTSCTADVVSPWTSTSSDALEPI